MTLEFAMEDPKIYVLVQAEVAGDFPLEDHVRDNRLVRFDATGGRTGLRQSLEVLDRRFAGRRLVIFCSVEASRMIASFFPNLAAGMVMNREFMHVHRYAAVLPADTLLNDRFVMLPFGLIHGARGMLQDLFGSTLFLRPDGPGKCFPGLTVDIDDLDRELFGLTQVHHVDPDVLCVIAAAQEVPDFEYRAWLIDGEAISPAGYALHREHGEAPPCPDEIAGMAQGLARYLEPIENAVVADFAMTAEGPRLVELNAIPTSGFYPGMDLRAVVRALDGLIA